jgi:beta-fructofuranosidase
VGKGRALAMYYGTEMGTMVAVSGDPLLLNWEEVTRQPVIPSSSRNGAELPYRVQIPVFGIKVTTTIQAR